MEDHSNTTKSEDRFMLGFFRFPTDIDVNYDALEMAYDIIVFLSLPLNIILLAMILKNPNSKTWTNMSIILASMCLLNLAANVPTAVNQIDIIYREDKPRLIANEVFFRILSMTFTMYYVSAFLLALDTYVMIVKPFVYKVFSPKPRNVVCIIFLLWLTAGGAFFVLPILVHNYLEVTQTAFVSFCWVVTFIMAIFYSRILSTLCRRKRELTSTLNATASRQGLLVLKQNSRLATVLFVYIFFMVLMSLPVGTCILLVNNCKPCDNHVTVKIILHLVPFSVSMSALFPVHWFLGTPQYYKEFKRLSSKLSTSFMR